MIQECFEGVWQAKGSIPGQTITIIGGTHGNERTGIEVVKELKTMIHEREVVLVSGVLNFILGNPKAIEMNTRGSAPHQDLNRSFPPSLLEREPVGTYEDTRARELAPLLVQSDVVVDLHATNKPSEPFLACIDSEEHKKISQWFPCEKILTDPDFVLGGEPVTTDEFVEAHGGIGICYETGQAGDTSHIDEVLENILNLLAYTDLIERDVPSVHCQQEVYQMIEPITLTEEGFDFADGYGQKSWESFSAGGILGYRGSDSFTIDYDGVIVFPKLKEHQQVGKPIAYLAKKVS